MKTSINKLQVLCGNLFKIRDTTHLAHLNVKNEGSYAKHIALNEYYESLLDMIDTLIESCQGKYGLMKLTINSTETNDANLIVVYNNIAKTLESDRNDIEES